ncbi:MAG: uracil-DNA glycosylase [Deltaproteobacteria bacterium]|nr:uracil-DNA glycosylase [Deltaproteobacteria bacterium]
MEDEYSAILTGLKRRLELIQASGVKELLPLKTSLAEVNREAASCARCPLARGRKAVIFGTGPEKPEIVFVGGAPLPHDEAKGAPFAGEDGELLRKIIDAMGFDLNEVYLACAVKCQAGKNTEGLNEAASSCSYLLVKELRALSPKAVIALGPLATLALTGSSDVKGMRGRFLSFNGMKLMSTYDTATLIKNPGLKTDVWNDMKMVCKKLGRKIKA